MASNTTRSIGAAIALTFALGLGSAGVVGAQSDYTSQGSASVSDTTPAPGEQITVSGVTEPNATVTVTVGSSSSGSPSAALVAAQTAPMILGTTTADAAGAYSLTVTIPSSLAAGSYVLSVAANGDVISSTALTVGAANGTTNNQVQNPTTPAASNETLAFTGAESAPMAGLALAAIGAGGALVVLSRRRNEAPAI